MAETIYLQVSEQFMRLAEDGQVPKDVLAEMLEPESRGIYLQACAAIERRYTEACDAAGDPCLESGCSVDHQHGEACLQPLLRAETEYHKACAAEWIRLFKKTT
jgi:hypothetical protein